MRAGNAGVETHLVWCMDEIDVIRSGQWGEEQGVELRCQGGQQLDGKRTGKMVVGRDGARHVGRDSAIEAVAKEEGEGRGPVDHPRRDRLAASGEALEAVVASTGLAADQ